MKVYVYLSELEGYGYFFVVDISRVLNLEYRVYQMDIYKVPTFHDSVNTKSFF